MCREAREKTIPGPLNAKIPGLFRPLNQMCSYISVSFTRSNYKLVGVLILNLVYEFIKVFTLTPIFATSKMLGVPEQRPTVMESQHRWSQQKKT